RGIVADVMEIDARVIETAGSAQGAAMLGGIAAGIFRDTADARDRCRGGGVQVAHDPSRSRIYSEQYGRYKDLKEIFDRGYHRDA
ncbi:MAG: hypothetical protein JXA20_05305, partial [Spirochaetes bacterium]|nr:hypothetical protein [Spirochaetota bacterium]